MLPPCFHDMRMERYHHVIVVCHLAESACMFEPARVLVRLDHVERLIINANHTVMWTAAKLCVSDFGVAAAAGALPTR